MEVFTILTVALITFAGLLELHTDENSKDKGFFFLAVGINDFLVIILNSCLGE